MHRLPPVLDLRILGTCDLRCPFCFGPRHELKMAPLQSLLNLIRQLPGYGVQDVVFTGGEPALVRQLPVLLQTAKRAGLKTILSTNGIIFRKRIAEIAPYLDWVGLPLDADCSEINQQMRVGYPQHFENILDLIMYIRENYPHLQIKLGTVVCAINKEHVVRIPNVLGIDRKPDTWKLYQVTYSSYGADNRDFLSLSDEEYEQVLTLARREASKYKWSVIAYKRAERAGTYLFLEPTGDAVAISQEGETVIGNFFKDIDEVVARWGALVNLERMHMNFTSTYPYRE